MALTSTIQYINIVDQTYSRKFESKTDVMFKFDKVICP
jgi:hypothetical protein